MGEHSITAKPRRYSQTNFRSTLEADWACTLDGLGITWEYEPKAITLPSGDTYIPDFWLPEIGTWIEVKGDNIPRTEKAVEFARTLACTCPPPPAPCTCDWEGGQIVIIGHPSVMGGNDLRFGALYWSDPIANAMLTTCLKCNKNFWIRPRYSWRCRNAACRTWRPRQVHFRHLYGSGSPEIEFRHADRIKIGRPL